MNPKISVIIPVYNVERYLSRCIESLLIQTYRNFEIILVDDGSTDRCSKICETYAKKYDFVKVFHKANEGQGAARNFGVKIARGEFISFVDSDDYVNPRYLEILLKGIENSDISVVDFLKVYNENQIQNIADMDIHMDIYTAENALSQILYQQFHDVAPWGILLPKNIVEKYPFPEGKLFEDYFVTYKYYLNVRKVSFIRMPLYYYFIRDNSTMSIRDKRFVNDLMEAADEVIKGCCGNYILEDAAKCKRFSNYCRILIQTPSLKEKYPNYYFRIINTLKQERLSVLFNSRARVKNRLAALALYGGIMGLKIAARL